MADVGSGASSVASRLESVRGSWKVACGGGGAWGGGGGSSAGREQRGAGERRAWARIKWL